MNITESEKNIHKMSETEGVNVILNTTTEIAKNLTLRGEGNFYEIPDTPVGRAIQKGHQEGLKIMVENIGQALLRKAIANS